MVRRLTSIAFASIFPLSAAGCAGADGAPSPEAVDTAGEGLSSESMTVAGPGWTVSTPITSYTLPSAITTVGTWYGSRVSQPVTVVLCWGAGSSQLYTASLQGTVLPTVTIVGGGYRVTLTNAVITSDRIGYVNGVETTTLHFSFSTLSMQKVYTICYSCGVY
jgi:hypothetical protein